MQACRRTKRLGSVSASTVSTLKMSRTDTCDMKKMGDGARPPTTDGAHPTTTDGARSPATDGARPSTTDGAISPATDGARSPATGDDHAREASAGCSVSACHIDRLPAELLQQVLSHLSLWEQRDAELVSRRWRRAVHALLRCRQVLDMRAWRIPGGWRDETLSLVLRLMPSLRVLYISDTADTRAYTLDIIATHCTRLVEVDLDCSRRLINEDSLKRLCRACPSLEKVRLRNASESGVRVMLQHLPALRTLELHDCWNVTGQCFSLLPVSLRRLSVVGCAYLRSDALLQVGTRCPQLRELDVFGVEPAHVSAALSGCPLLERLTARRLYAPLERCLPPVGLPGLRHLDVSFMDGVTDSTLCQLLPDLLPALQTLNIRACKSVTEEGLLQVCRWQELVSLDLRYLSGVTDAVLDRLHELPLKEIHLARCPWSMTTRAFTEQGIVRLVLACKSLTLLDVSGHPYTLITAMVNQLLELLPPSRSVTLWVGDTELSNLPPLPPGPLRLQKRSVV